MVILMWFIGFAAAFAAGYLVGWEHAHRVILRMLNRARGEA